MAKKVKKKKKTSRKLLRLLVIVAVFTVLFVLLALKLCNIKFKHGEEYQKAAEMQQVATEDDTVAALRGTITDSNGTILAQSIRTYNVIMDCKAMQTYSEKEQRSSLRILASALGKNEDDFAKYFTSEYEDYQYLKLPGGVGVSQELKESLQESIDSGKLVGVWFEETAERMYPSKTLAAHVIGFGGVYGVEGYYNDYLNGTAGRRMTVYNQDGKYTTEYIEPKDGCNITLTINSTVQLYLEKILAEKVKFYQATRGSAIVMNAKTGEIIAMCNVPTFDPNNVTDLYEVNDKYIKWFGEYKEDGTFGDDYYARTWNNNCVNMTYEPGSTYKPVFAAMALEEKIITQTTKFTCKEEGYNAAGSILHCASGAVHGKQTIREILTNSCNQGMASISRLVKPSTYFAYQQAYGIGQLTGIDLVGEVSASNLIYYEDSLHTVQMATCSFGQGFNVTPMQMLVAFTAVINGGEVLQPYVVSKITDADGSLVLENHKTVVRHVISAETSALMRDNLCAVVEARYPGAHSAYVEGYKIGGKTGTGQQGGYTDAEKDICSFIGFTSPDNPQYVVMALFDGNASDSSRDAAATVGAIFEAILPILGIYKEN